MNLFNEETFPYEFFEGFGLSREMIDDLPGHVLETIGSGGRSPLLPIEIPTKFGSVTSHAKFRLTDMIMEDGKYGVIFYPQLIESDLSMFTEEEKQQLLDGKTVLAHIHVPNAEEVQNDHKEKCFVQIDRDTNHVFYALASVIGRNLKSIDSMINLSDEDIERLSRGELVTVIEPEFMTLGINIFSDTGILVCAGDEANWRNIVGKQIDKYNFGMYGCWVNDEGLLRYVKEDDFDESIIEAQTAIKKRNAEKQEKVCIVEDENQNTFMRKEDSSQITR